MVEGYQHPCFNIGYSWLGEPREQSRLGLVDPFPGQFEAPRVIAEEKARSKGTDCSKKPWTEVALRPGLEKTRSMQKPVAWDRMDEVEKGIDVVFDGPLVYLEVSWGTVSLQGPRLRIGICLRWQYSELTRVTGVLWLSWGSTMACIGPRRARILTCNASLKTPGARWSATRAFQLAVAARHAGPGHASSLQQGWRVGTRALDERGYKRALKAQAPAVLASSGIPVTSYLDLSGTRLPTSESPGGSSAHLSVAALGTDVGCPGDARAGSLCSRAEKRKKTHLGAPQRRRKSLPPDNRAMLGSTFPRTLPGAHGEDQAPSTRLQIFTAKSKVKRRRLSSLERPVGGTIAAITNLAENSSATILHSLLDSISNPRQHGRGELLTRRPSYLPHPSSQDSSAIMVSKNRILQHFNRHLAIAFGVIAVSTFNYGFDNAAYNNTQAMAAFKQQFGEWDAGKDAYAIPTAWLSLFNSLNYIGFGAGVIIGSLVSARWGRRWCMFTMSAWALVPAIMAITSETKEQIMATRILNFTDVYIGMELAVVPVYQSEIMPAEIRGFAVGSYQFSLMMGTLIVSCVCRGTSTLPGNQSFRIPFGLFFIIPVLIMIAIFFIPESPRWLLTKDRPDEARAALGKLRAGRLTETEIDEQLAGLQYALDREPEQGRYVELFQGKNLKRTAIVVAMNFFQQATGQAFASTYGAVFVSDIGTVNPFTMTIVNAVVNLGSAFTGLYLVDRLGRRPLLFTSAGWMFAAIVTMGALGTVSDPSFGVKSGIVAMLTLFGSGFTFAFAPLNYVVTTEVPSLRLRDASQRTASIVNVVTNFLVSFSIPYLLYDAGLSSKLGFVFAGILALSILFIYFGVPECKGKSLEQVDRMFNEGISPRKFGNYKPTEVVADSQDGAEKGVPSVVVKHQEQS
ncbi:hypothetical protein FZEAL_5406 [Fusarium zealandicum]|uniref:Major facilitator superfamily (MFS) profile domain-containing protein n=1 Tax=Fusarium zealandicum TaxID=1053134 RepID=A0A8H4UJT7_9HYPO|nr:hypothetical protein FZEAL_5406 [Fusarium zealandicum]